MNLILIDSAELGEEGHVRLRDERGRHIREVLKTPIGGSVRIGLVNGPCGAGVVESVAPDGVKLKCSFRTDEAPPPKVDLLLALPRPKVLKRLWAQIAALGVGRIILTNAWKVERVYFDSHVLDAAFYRPLLVEGLQQARHTHLPEVTIHRRFKVLMEDELDNLFPAGARLAAVPGAGRRMRDLIFPDPEMRVLLAVGPEGGWTGYEMEMLAQHGFRPVSIGGGPLRTDTACISLLALLNEALN
jgi:RsmE family RNA methyltransferase